MSTEIESFAEKWPPVVKKALDEYIEAELAALRMRESSEEGDKAGKVAAAKLSTFLTVLKGEEFNPPEGFQVVDLWGPRVPR